jgi:hypothetical protein
MRPPALASRFVLPRRRSLVFLALSLAAGLAPVAQDVALADELPEFRVIVHPKSALRAAGRGLLADAFLKKVTRWATGEPIRPVDLQAGNRVRRRFSEAILKRSVGAVRSYWQQRIFSGRDVPPPEFESDDSVIAFVAKYEGAIGYVSGGAKLVGVRELSFEQD